MPNPRVAPNSTSLLQTEMKLNDNTAVTKKPWKGHPATPHSSPVMKTCRQGNQTMPGSECQGWPIAETHRYSDSTAQLLSRKPSHWWFHNRDTYKFIMTSNLRPYSTRQSRFTLKLKQDNSPWFGINSKKRFRKCLRKKCLPSQFPPTELINSCCQIIPKCLVKTLSQVYPAFIKNFSTVICQSFL